MSLAPIDEETSEAGDLASNGGGVGDDDEPPITMIPRIMHTAPSPTTENAMTQIGRSNPAATSSADNSKPLRNGAGGNVDQIESVL